MPFVSQKQRAWMHANHPQMAKRWEAHTPKGKKLPKRVRKSSKPTTNKSTAAKTASAYGGAVQPVGWDPDNIAASCKRLGYTLASSGANRIDDSMPFIDINSAYFGRSKAAASVNPPATNTSSGKGLVQPGDAPKLREAAKPHTPQQPTTDVSAAQERAFTSVPADTRPKTAKIVSGGPYGALKAAATGFNAAVGPVKRGAGPWWVSGLVGVGRCAANRYQQAYNTPAETQYMYAPKYAGFCTYSHPGATNPPIVARNYSLPMRNTRKAAALPQTPGGPPNVLKTVMSQTASGPPATVMRQLGPLLGHRSALGAPIGKGQLGVGPGSATRNVGKFEFSKVSQFLSPERNKPADEQASLKPHATPMHVSTSGKGKIKPRLDTMVQTGDKVWGKGGDIDRIVTNRRYQRQKYAQLAKWADLITNQEKQEQKK